MLSCRNQCFLVKLYYTFDILVGLVGLWLILQIPQIKHKRTHAHTYTFNRICLTRLCRNQNMTCAACTNGRITRLPFRLHTICFIPIVRSYVMEDTILPKDTYFCSISVPVLIMLPGTWTRARHLPWGNEWNIKTPFK
jgi:hypothetical protein